MELQEWFESSAEETAGVILLSHGLNNRPELMHPIAKAFTKSGFDVLVPALKGHVDDFATFKKVKGEDWLADVITAYNKVHQRASLKNCPVFYVGFSLGGLIGVTLKAQGKLPEINKMWLLAPALEITWFASLLKPLLNLKLDFSIPSRAPGFYRAHQRMPIQAYRALFEVKELLQQQSIVNTPTLLHIDAKDELVSFKKLKKLIVQEKLSNWQLHKLDSKESKGIHHMIADPFYTGKNNWQTMLNKAIDFFKS